MRVVTTFQLKAIKSALKTVLTKHVQEVECFLQVEV